MITPRDGQLAGYIAALPDSLQALADQRLYGLAAGVGLPAPAAVFTSEVAGNMLLIPVMRPMEKTLHGLEVGGVVIGLLGGPHALAIICVQHLIHDEIGDLLSNTFNLPASKPTASEPRPWTRPSPFGLNRTGRPGWRLQRPGKCSRRRA